MGLGRGSLVPRLSPTLAERAWECSVKGLGRCIWTFIGCKKWFHLKLLHKVMNNKVMNNKVMNMIN